MFFETGSMGAVTSKQVKFVKASFVEQQVDSFTREQLALFVLALDCTL
jgi:hypothetical protein